MYYYDATYILVIIGAVISLAASARVNSVFKKYSKVANSHGYTGAEMAARVLQENGLRDVAIQRVSGSLTDHYDPSTETVNLSETVYGSRSISAIAVAAHECGHAIQHADGYKPLTIRSKLVPAANFGSNIGIYVVMAGLILGLTDTLCVIGIVMFSLGVLFQLVTLPVELDASARALRAMKEDGTLADPEEYSKAKSVLSAAALTYVAGAAASVLSLLRLIMMVNRRRD